MNLTDNDKRMLDGAEGPLVREAMKFLVNMGQAFGAEEMIDLDYAYVYIDCMDSWGKGDLTENLIEAGLAAGNRCKIPTTTWVSGREVDPALSAVLGLKPENLDELRRESELGKRLGMIHVDTCAPYLVCDLARPAFGAHIASIESSAVSYFNTAMGVRSNRDGISAFFGSLTGRYPNFGMHTDAGRRGKFLFDVKCAMRHSADYSALGFWIGKYAGLDVPVITGLGRMTTEQMQCLCGALAVGGAVSMAHIVGVTPEAPTLSAAFGGKKPAATFEVSARELDEVYQQFNSAGLDKVDFITLGCPHASILDIQKYAEKFRGRRVAPGVKVWLMTAAQNFFLAGSGGELQTLKDAGVEVVITCPIVNPGVPGPFNTFHDKSYSIGNFATNSMKLLYYSRNCMRPNKTFFGSTDECVEAAITGRWAGKGSGLSGGTDVSRSTGVSPVANELASPNQTCVPPTDSANPTQPHKRRTLTGRTIVPGRAEGLALVAADPVSFLGMVNTEDGTFDYPGHPLQGQTIKGRILIYPFGKGSSGDCIRMWRLDKFGVAPAGILFERAEPIHVQGALLLAVPTAYGLKDLCKLVKNGDKVIIDNGRVTIIPA